jgi:hypothetical protein
MSHFTQLKTRVCMNSIRRFAKSLMHKPSYDLEQDRLSYPWAKGRRVVVLSGGIYSGGVEDDRRKENVAQRLPTEEDV